MTRTRQAVLVILVAFALYAVISDPEGSGGAVRDALGMLGEGVQGLAAFARAVING